MRIPGGNGALEIERARFEGSGASDPDLLLNVSVRVGQYSAGDHTWVTVGDWRRFMGDVRALEATRHGSATIRGARPEDLEVQLFSTDVAGHMAVKGHLAWEPIEGHAQRLNFSFPFEAELLLQIVDQLAELEDEEVR